MDGTDDLALQICTAGTLIVSQRAQETVLHRGDATLLSAAETVSIACPSPARFIHVQLPWRCSRFSCRASVGDVEITGRVYATDDWPTGGVLIGADKGLFLARETNGNVTIAPVGAADTGYVHVIRALPEGGTLIGSRKGWFVARETGGKLTLTPAGHSDGARVNHMRDFGGAVLIGGESGLFVAAAAPSCDGR